MTAKVVSLPFMPRSQLRPLGGITDRFGPFVSPFDGSVEGDFYLFAYNLCVFSMQACIASITAPRSPFSSNTLIPCIVVPPGEQTISLSSPG